MHRTGGHRNLTRDGAGATSDLKTFVAAWCLGNIAPLEYVDRQSEAGVFVLTYEELVMNPEAVLDKFAAQLEKENVDHMLGQVTTPSAVTDSTTRETKERIREGDRGYLVRKWRKQVTEKQENDLFFILDAFGVDTYRPGRFLAQKRFLHEEGAYS
jgi:hypothetical protein